MENKPPPLWSDTKEIESKDLRLPNSVSNHRKNNDESKPNNAGETPKTLNSNLSVNAKPFFPLNYQDGSYQPQLSGGSVGGSVPIQTHTVQNRLKKHKVADPNADASDFINTPDDNRLQHLIATLTKDPGQFSDLLDIFMDTLSPYYEDILVLARAAELLVLQAIDNPSFRYTAARLCCAIEQYCPAFRAQLYLTCEKELKNNVNKSGLVLFVAEIFTQLHHDNIYGKYLIEAYKQLINAGGNDNVKCVCQALKLTGYSLELCNKQAMDEVFAKLNQVSSTVTGTAASLINSVRNLRSSNWGHTNSEPSNNSESEQSYWGEVPSTVFYNADGSKFSNEESDFLAAHMNYCDEFEADLSDPDELCDPEPEMDEEIQAAFKDFVKLTKR